MEDLADEIEKVVKTNWESTNVDEQLEDVKLFDLMKESFVRDSDLNFKHCGWFLPKWSFKSWLSDSSLWIQEISWRMLKEPCIDISHFIGL